jgi:hypothetical protein
MTKPVTTAAGRIAIKAAELVAASMLVSAGVVAFECISIWLATRDRN